MTEKEKVEKEAKPPQKEAKPPQKEAKSPKKEAKPPQKEAKSSKKEAKSPKKEAKPKEGEEKSVAEGEVKPAESIPKKGRKKKKKHIPIGKVFIQSTFNNTIITFTDQSGNTASWASSGMSGFKGSRKSTPFAAQVAAESAAYKARDAGMRTVTVYLKGPGSGRESAVRAIQKSGIRITGIRDVTPIPHNGCRPPKRRRV